MTVRPFAWKQHYITTSSCVIYKEALWPSPFIDSTQRPLLTASRYKNTDSYHPDINGHWLCKCVLREHKTPAAAAAARLTDRGAAKSRSSQQSPPGCTDQGLLHS